MNSSDLTTNPLPKRSLSEPTKLLQECRHLAEQLIIHGATLKLTNQDQANLGRFEELLQIDYSDSEWSYLRLASGVTIRGIAALKNCLTRYRL